MLTVILADVVRTSHDLGTYDLQTVPMMTSTCPTPIALTNTYSSTLCAAQNSIIPLLSATSPGATHYLASSTGIPW
ncbi:hypothetical protein ANO14919_114540 [Xylariales sp. No.14919]|nr:hypothetical protein ANO14919_114540 [Xylariales sp. No.14919]